MPGQQGTWTKFSVGLHQMELPQSRELHVYMDRGVWWTVWSTPYRVVVIVDAQLCIIINQIIILE